MHGRTIVTPRRMRGLHTYVGLWQAHLFVSIDLRNLHTLKIHVSRSAKESVPPSPLSLNKHTHTHARACVCLCVRA